mgnify:FL=1
MEEKVKIYAYRLHIADNKVLIWELEFDVTETQKRFLLKKGVENTKIRLVYDSSSPIEEPVRVERREFFLRGRKTLNKEELNNFMSNDSIDNRVVCFREPSLEKALKLFKEYLEKRSNRLQEQINRLTMKKQNCQKFVTDVEGLLR